jgi:hypothetical protein
LAAVLGSANTALAAAGSSFGGSPANAAALATTADNAGALASLATAGQYLARAAAKLAGASS